MKRFTIIGDRLGTLSTPLVLLVKELLKIGWQKAFTAQHTWPATNRSFAQTTPVDLQLIPPRRCARLKLKCNQADFLILRSVGIVEKIFNVLNPIQESFHVHLAIKGGEVDLHSEVCTNTAPIVVAPSIKSLIGPKKISFVVRRIRILDT